MKSSKFFIIFFVFLAFLLCAIRLFADVTLNLVVVNPSESEEKVVPIKKSLPRGLKREDIKNTGGLKVDYDVRESMYYVYGDVTLGPKESKTFKIVINDIWRISEEEINDMLNILENKVDSITDPEQQETARLIGESLRERLESMSKQQTELAGDVEKRMEMYSVNVQRVKAIKDEIFSLEELAQYGMEESAVAESVTLIIEAENVLDKQIEVPLKYYLPKEIIPEYILNQGGFQLEYDFDRGQHYLTKTEAFDPQEVKRFSIEVRNVWSIPESLINGYVDQGVELSAKLDNTSYAEIAKSLLNEIQLTAGTIIESQRKAEDVKEHIATYRMNQQRVEVIKDDIGKLRKLLENIQEQDVASTKEIRNVLRDIEVFSGMKKVSDTVFKRIKRVATWKIIFTVVIFVIVLTIFFYTIWFVNLKKEESRKLKKIGKEG